MSNSNHRWARILVATVCFAAVSYAQESPRPLSAGEQSSADAVLLEARVNQFFVAFGKKDPEALMRTWSVKSPYAASWQKAMLAILASSDRIEIKSLKQQRAQVAGDQASIRVDLEINVLDTRTGRSATGFGSPHRILFFIKEAQEWRLWREISAEEDLAIRVAAAKADAQRLKLLEAEKDLVTPELRKALIIQGDRQRSQSNFTEAISIYDLARSIADRTGDRMGTAVALHSVAVAQAMQGDYGAALQGFKLSLAIKETLGDRAQIAATLNNIGNVYLLEGNYGLAMQFFQKSLALREELADRTAIAGSLNNIGNVYRFQGDYSLALEYYQKSLALKEGLGDKAAIAGTLDNIGSVYAEQGEYDQAMKLYLRSLALQEGRGSKSEIAITLDNIGDTFKARGDYAEALNYYQRSLSLREEIGGRYGVAEALNNIGFIRAKQGDYQKSLALAERATLLAREGGIREVLWQSRTVAAQAQLALGDAAAARQALDEAISIIETLRADVAGGAQQQQSFFEDKLLPYHLMVDLLVKQDKIGEALAYGERAKARVLLDVLHSGRTNITKAMSAAEREQEQSLKASLFALNAQIIRENSRSEAEPKHFTDLNARVQKARREREEFQTALYAAHPELRAQRGEVQPLALDEIARLLPDPRSALLEYVVTREKTFLFVITRAASGRQPAIDLQVYSLNITQTDLARLADSFRRQLAEHDLDFHQSALKLYELLLKPAQGALLGKNNVVIVPDQALWQLPFQALQPAPDRYVLEDYAISYSPSLSVLREMVNLEHKSASPAAAPPSLLALGNPSPGQEVIERLKTTRRTETLAPLPEAEAEVKALGHLYGGGQSKIYIGLEATESRLKAEAGNYQILHLAAHAVFNDASPMYSHIVLSQKAGDNKEDGLLEAWEMMDLDLKAETVVLSACETARGRVGAGEGLIGMTWALFVAGSPTTVVSQWQVDSASTTVLMLEFHRNLKQAMSSDQSGARKAEALRQAELKLLRSKEFRHPLYWAGFVLIGDGR